MRPLGGDAVACIGGDGGRLASRAEDGVFTRAVLLPFAFFLLPKDQGKDQSDSNCMLSNSLERGECSSSARSNS